MKVSLFFGALAVSCTKRDADDFSEDLISSFSNVDMLESYEPDSFQELLDEFVYSHDVKRLRTDAGKPYLLNLAKLHDAVHLYRDPPRFTQAQLRAATAAGLGASLDPPLRP